jgi:hypothetical protein
MEKHIKTCEYMSRHITRATQLLIKYDKQMPFEWDLDDMLISLQASAELFATLAVAYQNDPFLREHEIVTDILNEVHNETT